MTGLARDRGYLSISPDGRLRIDGVDAGSLIRQYGSPLYVLCGRRIAGNYHSLTASFESLYDDILICYAYKANSHLAVCRLLREQGAGAEVASGGELFISKKVGVPPDRVLFDGPNKTEDELETAIRLGVQMINADSMGEIDRIDKIAGRLGKKPRIGLRINPDISGGAHPHLATGLREHKFGIDASEAIEAYRMAAQKNNLQVVGIHSHIGSGILELDPFVENVKKIFDLVNAIRVELDIEITSVDLGGGLGIPYGNHKGEPATQQFAEKISEAAQGKIDQHSLKPPTLIFEFGRAIVGDAGVLLTTVGAVKTRTRCNWALVDAGMNTLLRPTLYDAYHEIVVTDKMTQQPAMNYSIGGPCCESGDYLGKDRLLPNIEPGDILAVLDVGAYGFTMSNHYNSYPKPATVMVRETTPQLIRSRESYDDLIAREMYS